MARKLIHHLRAAAGHSIATACALLSLACATTQTLAESTDEAPPNVDRRSDVVRQAELLTAHKANLGDALRQLRPRLYGAVQVNQGPTLNLAHGSLYLNDAYAGPASAVERMSVATVTEVRFIEPIAARARWGQDCQCDGGVILVRTLWGVRP